MKMYHCDACLSAGSVNQWGYCEICGADHPVLGWRGSTGEEAFESVASPKAEAPVLTIAVGSDSLGDAA